MELKRSTVSDLLWESMMKLFSLDSLKSFRLVGGTALSLQLGHRVSIDIDLFTDAEYPSQNFDRIKEELSMQFDYFDALYWTDDAVGNSCFVGTDPENLIKLDLFYTDQFVFPALEIHSLRIAIPEEIAAMKLDVISRGGRKKDFWDIHALFALFSLDEIYEFYKKRYPFGYKRSKFLEMLIHFEQAESDPQPRCLHGKYWELIKLDIEEICEASK